MPYGSIIYIYTYAPHTTNYNTHLLTAQTNKKDKSHTKERAFRKMEVQRKRSQANGPKAAKDKTEGATGEIEKWDQTGSPEIPNRRGTSEIPRPPFGVGRYVAYVLTLNNMFLMMMMMMMVEVMVMVMVMMVIMIMMMMKSIF